MKHGTCRVKLSKDMDVVKVGVTPIEAMLLVAEHHKNVGGSPIDVKEITDVKEIEFEVEETDDKGVTKKVKKTRSVDDELDRLRMKYHDKKIEAVLLHVKEMPTDFAAAIERGIRIKMPTGMKLSETKLI